MCLIHSTSTGCYILHHEQISSQIHLRLYHYTKKSGLCAGAWNWPSTYISTSGTQFIKLTVSRYYVLMVPRLGQWRYSILSLGLSWPDVHICPTYKESFQVCWDNSILLFLHAAIYLEVSLFRWTSQNGFFRETAV